MISTHILDTSLGNPASGVLVSLLKNEDGNWISLKSAKTDMDGRINFECQKNAGIYRLEFEIAKYFESLKKDYFFLMAPVIFEIKDISRNYHVPLLLNPFGYSTYRGS